MHITVVTSNHGKFMEMQDILSRFGIVAIQNNADTQETGQTLEERCLSKAKDAYKKIGKPLIVDDTGLFFNAFENFPGPFPKKVFSELGFDGILEKLRGKERGACFKTLVCYIDEHKNLFFEGTVKGMISEKLFDGGQESLPYDRIFIPEKHEQPFCMIPEKEKNRISHRAKAVESFAKWFIGNAESVD